MSEFLPIILSITDTPLFGIVLSLLTYALGLWLNQKAKSPLVNPMLISVGLIIAVLLLFGIPHEHFQHGGEVIELFLTPATAVLSIRVYEHFRLLKKNWIPVLVGAAVGSLVSILCVLFFCRLFHFDAVLTTSLLPKSVTTAIAVPLSAQNGGIPSITAAALLVTGMLGAIFAPYLVRLFRIKNPVEAGIAIGTSSHALGTSKALEMGDIEGAMSGCAIGIAGLFTVIFLMFF